MTRRRGFLQVPELSGVVPKVTAVDFGAQVAARHLPSSKDLHRVRVDARHAETHCLMSCFAHAGTPVHMLTDGDVMPLWLHEIGPNWRTRPQALAAQT
jgi:hypothetical protein